MRSMHIGFVVTDLRTVGIVDTTAASLIFPWLTPKVTRLAALGQGPDEQHVSHVARMEDMH